MGEIRLHHVNFHTALNTPVFEHDEYDLMMRGALGAAIEERQVLCVAWELMPTHVHLLIAEFEDLPRGTILKHLKGDTSAPSSIAIPLYAPICLADTCGRRDTPPVASSIIASTSPPSATSATIARVPGSRHPTR